VEATSVLYRMMTLIVGGAQMPGDRSNGMMQPGSETDSMSKSVTRWQAPKS
jgi:hypothetical protein